MAFVLGTIWTRGQSEKRKYIVWGLLVMFAIAPFSSFLIGIGYGIIVEDGFAGIGMTLIVIVVLFLAGLISLIIALSKKSIVEDVTA